MSTSFKQDDAVSADASASGAELLNVHWLISREEVAAVIDYNEIITAARIFAEFKVHVLLILEGL